jgi:hypothetical protein
MSKVTTDLNIRQGVSSNDQHHQSESDIQTPLNNKRSLRPITPLLPQTTPSVGHTLGTFDTIKLTSTGVKPSQILDIDSWTVGSNIRVSDLNNGLLLPLKKIVYIGKDGKETDKENSITTIGLEHKPAQHWRTGEDFCIVHISSAPSIMGHPWSPLLQSEVPGLIDRVQNIVGRYIDCDITTFNVSRLDSATIFNVQSPIRDYITAFDSMSAHKIGHSEKKFYDDETIQFFNKSISVGFYDKAKKDADSDIIIPSEYADIKGLRYEVQNKKKTSIKTVYGGIRFIDLCRDVTIHNCAKVRKDQFEKYWPKKDNTIYLEKYAHKNNISDLFKVFNQDYKRNVPQRTALAYLINSEMVTIKQWTDIMRSEGYDKSYIRKFAKELAEFENISIEVRDLHAEVYELIKKDYDIVAA